MSDDLVKRLRASLSMLAQEEAADRIEELEAENKRLRLEVAYANDTTDAAIERIKELEAKLSKSEALLEKAIEALVRIAGTPSEMIWGVDSEVREAMNGMEIIAETTLAKLTGGRDE